MIEAWRIVKKKHVATAFSGEGARLFGGRWNSIGVSVVYTASTTSLAALEMLVHLPTHEILRKYVVIQLQFEEGFVTKIDPNNLPFNWDDDPPPVANQQIGDQWAKGLKSAVCKVPSAIIKNEYIYLLNPKHPDFNQFTIGKPMQFLFDPRLNKS